MTFDELQCPFCKERDFDEIGLKVHLLRGWCDQFNDVDTLASSLPERHPPRRVAHVWEGRPCCVNCNASAWDKDIPEFCKGAPAEPPKAPEQGVIE